MLEDFLTALQKELYAAALAGINTLKQNDRLSRAVKQLSEMTEKAPVLTRLQELCTNLLSGDCRTPAETLLDAAALADALCCAQAPYQVEGVPEALAVIGTKEEPFCQSPCSEVRPLYEALTWHKKNADAELTQAFQNRAPALWDWRLRRALVQSFDQDEGKPVSPAESILKMIGVSVVPVLKDSLNPMDKKTAPRRVALIAALSDEEEKEFYLEMIETGCPGAKLAAVRGIERFSDSAALLMKLAPGLTGNAKKEAYWLLSGKSSPELDLFWATLVRKKPNAVLPFLARQNGPLVSQAIAQLLQKTLKTALAEDPAPPLELSFCDRLAHLFFDVRCKTSPEMEQALAFCAEHARAAVGAACRGQCAALYELLSERPPKTQSKIF